MSCPECGSVFTNGIYICHINDYRILDNNNNLVYICSYHDLPIDDPEINDTTNVKYCNNVNCKHYVEL